MLLLLLLLLLLFSKMHPLLYSFLPSIFRTPPHFSSLTLTHSCTVHLQCRGIQCQPGSSSLEQQVEVVSSVGFVDVSNKPEAQIKPVPTFEAKAASDFFFPFLWSILQGNVGQQTIPCLTYCHPQSLVRNEWHGVTLIVGWQLTWWSRKIRDVKKGRSQQRPSKACIRVNVTNSQDIVGLFFYPIRELR